MNLSEIRKSARENLKGKWETAVIFTLVYVAIELGISLIYGILSFIPFVSTVAYAGIMVISIPITYGLTACFMKIKRGEKIEYLDYLKIGFSNFKKSWCITGNILKKIWVYLVIYICLDIVIAISSFCCGFFSAIFDNEYFLIINSIFLVFLVIALLAILVLLMIKAYYYVLANFIAIDNSDMSAKDVVDKSKELMEGKRAKYFLLELSFIGWAILSVFTLGIGLLWLVPYMQIAMVIFYEKVIGKTEDYTSTPVSEDTTEKIEGNENN